MLAIYFMGTYQMYVVSQCIANAQTVGDRHTEVPWTGSLLDRPESSACLGERCWLLRAAGLGVTESPADTGVILSHWFTFCLQATFPSPFLHWWKSDPPFLLPPSLWPKGWSETVNRLSGGGGDRCYLPCPGPQGTQNHPVSVALLGEVRAQYSIIGFNRKSSVTMDWSMWVNTQVSSFWHFNLGRILVWSMLLWGPRSIFSKAALQNWDKPLLLSYARVLCTCVICQC